MRGPSFALALAAGCGPSSGDKTGELGHGRFTWSCSSPADPACPEPGEATFPDVVALGSQFALRYEGNGGGSFVPRSSSAHLVELYPPGLFLAQQPGFAGVVVYKGEYLHDLLHLDVRPVDQLVLSTRGLAGGRLELGDEAGLLVSAQCGDALCGGALPYRWTVDPPGVLDLQGADPDDARSVRAREAGVATVTVSDGQRQGTVIIEVFADEPPEETADTGQADTGQGPETADTGLAGTGSAP